MQTYNNRTEQNEEQNARNQGPAAHLRLRLAGTDQRDGGAAEQGQRAAVGGLALREIGETLHLGKFPKLSQINE